VYSDEQRFFGHFGGHRLHDNRYVITKFGSVLDLKDNTWIHKETDADVLAIEGNKVIYRVDRFGANEGIFAFDLTKRTVEKSRSSRRSARRRGSASARPTGSGRSTRAPSSGSWPSASRTGSPNRSARGMRGSFRWRTRGPQP
jgi:hypothetical protein